MLYYREVLETGIRVYTMFVKTPQVYTLDQNAKNLQFILNRLVLWYFSALCSGKKGWHPHHHHGHKPDCDENGNPIKDWDDDGSAEDEDDGKEMDGTLGEQNGDYDDMMDCEDIRCDENMRYDAIRVDDDGEIIDDYEDERQHVQRCCDRRR